MENKEYYTWVRFYSEFADKLLTYKNDRKTLIAKLQNVYQSIGMKFPKMERDGMPSDMEPFSVFGMFSKGITDANRIVIIKGMAAEFHIGATIPTSFYGIPLLNNLRATFFYFEKDRGEHDIDNLWSVYEAALTLATEDSEANRETFAKYYNLALRQHGVRWNITMGLFWIRPYTFLNLDSRNRWYMSNPDNMPAEFATIIQDLSSVPNAKRYLDIRDACLKVLQAGHTDYTNFPELSYNAWTVSEVVNQEIRATTKKNNQSNAAFLHWMKPLIQALRDLGGSATPQQARQRIIENEQLTKEEISETRGKNKVNKFENEVAFARSYLVTAGYIDKSVYGIWTLTEAGKIVDMTEEMASNIFKKGVADNQSKRENVGAALADENIDSVHYWIYTPGHASEKWEDFYEKGIIALGWGEIGDLEAFASKDEMKQKMKEVYGVGSSYKNSGHATWQFSRDMKIGDIIFVKKDRNTIIGRGIIDSDYEYDDERTDDYNNVRHVKWTNKGEWKLTSQTPLKTLTDVTPYSDFVDQIKALFEDEMTDDAQEQELVYPPYTQEDFLDEVFMDEHDYHTLIAIIKTKMNVILQGAPGVGKTFAAKRLVYSIMGVKDKERVMMVQFHQSYSYEDFIIGFRPAANGFELKKGAFYNFCKKAEIDSDNEYFFIIDEINRGNLSKIFGELFMLIENDKRGIELQLLYSDEKFSVPENVYIIGMMNTADRSLAMLDYALRRRFAFFELKPGFESEGFRAYQMNLDNAKFDRLINCVQSLNNTIAADESLGEGFRIGHSYFCNLKPKVINDQYLFSIVNYELIPLLKEYWFDEPIKVKDWSNNLRSAIK